MSAPEISTLTDAQLLQLAARLPRVTGAGADLYLSVIDTLRQERDAAITERDAIRTHIVELRGMLHASLAREGQLDADLIACRDRESKR